MLSALSSSVASDDYVATVALAAVISACAVLLARGAGAARAVLQHRRIVAGRSELNDFIANRLRPTLDKYSPTWWANAHVQVALTFLVPQADVQYDRELLTLQDGGCVALDWALPPADAPRHDLPDDAPIVVVMHGLTGCSASMRSLCASALAKGYRAVVFNKRGHGGVQLATPKLQEFGCVRDLNQALDRVQSRFPTAPLYGVGFSAGSGLLCSYLGETGDDSRLRAGVLISPGYNALDLFCHGRIHPWYNYLMTYSLKQFLQRHERELKDVIDVDQAMQATSIKEFDERVFMAMHGYDDLEAYWARNNPMRDVHSITRPLLCLNALDDPVCTRENIAFDVFVDNPTCMLVETGTGSHCAFYEGHLRLKSWANDFAIEYLDHLREFEATTCRSTDMKTDVSPPAVI